MLRRSQQNKGSTSSGPPTRTSRNRVAVAVPPTRTLRSRVVVAAPQTMTLRSRVAVIPPPLPHKCNNCPERFATILARNMHCMETHLTAADSKKYCVRCDKVYSSETSLLKHRFTLHNEVALGAGWRTYRCDICVRTYYDKSIWQRHTRVHTGEKPYICNICDKPFTTLYNAQNHVRVHFKEKPFVCRFGRCRKKYASTGGRWVHELRIHGGNGKKRKKGMVQQKQPRKAQVLTLTPRIVETILSSDSEEEV